jgi:hypothetical protein
LGASDAMEEQRKQRRKEVPGGLGKTFNPNKSPLLIFSALSKAVS